MKITVVKCTPFSIPMRTPFHWGTTGMAAAENVLVQVETDEGITGTAEAPSRPTIYGESQESMAAAVRRWFGPALAGSDPFDIEGAWGKFDQVIANNTVKGALDMALHDIIGQALGVPCYRLLGGYGRSLQVSYMCGLGQPEQVVEEAQRVQGQYGIRAFKLKAGQDPARDVALMRAVRKALPEILLYLDANQGWTFEAALSVLQEAKALGLAWLEEPCPTHDRFGRQRVAAMSPVPILGDESCRTMAEVSRELAEHTVQMVSIKAARTGFRLSSLILGACAAAAARPIIGSQGDTGIGALASLHFGAANKATAALPGELSFFLGYADDLLAEPLRIKDGQLTAPERPGLGIVIDRDKLARYHVS